MALFLADRHLSTHHSYWYLLFAADWPRDARVSWSDHGRSIPARDAFFSNFLIELGRTSTPSGQDNLVLRLLFLIALIIEAVGITLLFAAFAQFFVNPGTARWLSRLDSVSG